jgi:hypothetical protein
MARPQPGNPPIPESFSAEERILVEKTETAVHDGLQLETWMRGGHGHAPEFQLNLDRPFKLPNRAMGYFGEVLLNQKPTTVMGVRQECDFGRITNAGDAAEVLMDYVFGQFLPTAHWTYPDGYPGGFTLTQSLYRRTAGGYGKFPAEQSAYSVDWRKIGVEYDWVAVVARIHDFVLRFGPMTKRPDEAACVAPCAGFVHVTEKPAPGCELELAIGYPFVEVTPIPNKFGFGPGKFGLACKLYSFILTSNKEVKATMDFAAAPRCSRVLDFGPGAWDPVYGGAELLRKLTFGAYNPQPFHDKLDAFMVTTHARVHQSLLEGASKIFNDWQSGGSR